MVTTMAPPFDPVKMASFVFGHDHWQIPEEILRAVFMPHSRVAVKSCHASSKSFTASDAVLMALLAGGDVIVTAPTWTQVEQVLFGQVHAAIATSRVALPDWGSVNRTEIRLPTGEFALGLSTDQSVRFQGYHAKPGRFLLVIFDEAPGVRPDIYEAVEGVRSGGDVRLLFIGNPVISSGPFYDIFSGDWEGWDRFTISAFDTPNFAGLTIGDVLRMSSDELDDNVRPYLITRRFVYEKYFEWGTDHPLYQARVLGAFPIQGEDALLSLTWLEQAKARAERSRSVTELSAGIDVAGPGEDETTLTIRAGDDILHQQAWAQADARGAVLAELRTWLPDGLKIVNIDSAGLGYHWFLDLRDALKASGVTVSGINVGESSDVLDKAGNRRFSNLKAELYWAFRERAAAGELTGLKDQRAIAQLAGIRYKHDAHGRVVIESKDDARKRGVKSPDRAESVILAFAPPRDRLARAFDNASAKPPPALTPQQQVRRHAINSPEYQEPKPARPRLANGWR